MKYKNPRNLNRFRQIIGFAAALVTCSSQLHAAGLNDATSAYATIQPNAAGTHTLFTISWVAPDTDQDGNGVTDAYIPNFGNANSKLDNAVNLQGGDLFTLESQGIQYIHNAANNATEVQWTDPANYTVGETNPTAISREWRNLGGFGVDIWSTNVQAYGSGEGGVTGVFSSSADGTGATTGSGVGITYDWNSSSSTDLGFLLSGVSGTPNTGYIQIAVPNPTVKWNDPANGDFTQVPHAFALADKFIEGTYVVNSSIELTVTNDANYTPKLAVSGDFDSDLDVDAGDLAAAAAGFGGAGVTGKWYATGDTNADGDSDNADLGAVIGAFTPGSASATTADLVYDPATGNVKLSAAEAAGAIITSFQLENSVGSFVDTNFSGPGGSFGGTYQDVTVNVIGDTDLTLTGFSGIVDLGNVFPTGLDAAGLEAYLTTAVYTGSAGTGQQEFDLVVDLGGGGDPPFTVWSNGAAADEDSNGDGIDNGIAWALGATGPEQNALDLLPTLDNTSDTDFFIFTFNRGDEANDDAGTSIAVEYASDLSDWTVAVAGDDVMITETEIPGTPKDAVEVKIRRTLAVGDKLFARLKVVVTP